MQRMPVPANDAQNSPRTQRRREPTLSLPTIFDCSTRRSLAANRQGSSVTTFSKPGMIRKTGPLQKMDAGASPQRPCGAYRIASSQ
jgi:hypothetical protein